MPPTEQNCPLQRAESCEREWIKESLSKILNGSPSGQIKDARSACHVFVIILLEETLSSKTSVKTKFKLGMPPDTVPYLFRFDLNENHISSHHLCIWAKHTILDPHAHKGLAMIWFGFYYMPGERSDHLFSFFNIMNLFDSADVTNSYIWLLLWVVFVC